MGPTARKLQCTIEAIIHIALYHGTQPINGKALAESLGLTPRYLERVMQSCVRDGILRSIRGPRGGYVLARERRHITLGDVYRAVIHSDDEPQEAARESALNQHIIHPACQQAMEALQTAFDEQTIADLCDQTYHHNLFNSERPKQTPHASRQDFTI